MQCSFQRIFKEKKRREECKCDTMAASSLPLHDMLQYDGRAASQKCRAEINSSSNERHLFTLHPSKNFNKHVPQLHFSALHIFRGVSTN